MMMIYSKLVARWQQRPASYVATRGRKIDTGLFRFRLSHHLIFYSAKTVIKRNCVQSSYTYTYNKMLWRQMCRHISVISTGWWRGTVVERRSLAGELSLSCARPAADG